MFTDRSRIEAYQTCPQYRFRSYHARGTGLLPIDTAYELQFGLIYHAALERLLKGTPPAIVINQATIDLQKSNVYPANPDGGFIEQRYLLEGLLWAFALYKLPLMESQYEVVTIGSKPALEYEFEWLLGTLSNGEPLIMMSRLDALQRERATRSLFYREFKTTSYGDDRWALQFEKNAQIMAGITAASDLLGERLTGALVQGHIKGARRRDTARSSSRSGLYIQDSPLCYCWARSGVYSPEYTRGTSRIPVWETGFEPRTWVEKVLGENLALSLFADIEPISPDPFFVARWQREVTEQEDQIRKRLLRDPDGTSFHHHETSCFMYGRRCSHYQGCWLPGTQTDLVVRVPNHRAERDAAANDQA